MGSSAGDSAQSYMNQYNKMNPNRAAYDKGSLEALNAYSEAAQGASPSVAREQLRETTQENIANQASMAASGRGRDPAAAQRQAAYNSAVINQKANQQGAIVRADEMEKGRAGLAGVAGAGLQRMDAGAANFAQTGAGVGKAQDDQQNKILSGIGSGLAVLSDEKFKTGIKDGGDKVDKFLDSIKAYAYKYKEGVDAPEGEHVSPMAQDLEKSSMGKDMVENTPEGKVVDYGRGFGAMLAAQAHLNERLNKLEKKRTG